jgi:Glyoxalase-like domain
MAQLGDIVFDCRHPASLARFWAAVFDGYAVAPYDEAELSRLRDLGINDPERHPRSLNVKQQPLRSDATRRLPRRRVCRF